jgi:urease accessory protein
MTARTDTTRIEVGGSPGRPWCTLRGGPLVPRRLPDENGAVRVALVASTALLLAGDRVAVSVRVAEGHRLEVLETAGTVAYAMRGGSARWDVHAEVAESAVLTWGALPFVVADGARVHRSSEVDLAEGATAVLRESLVLGRTGQEGGVLESRSRYRLAGRPLLVESLWLDPDARRNPAVLAGARCLDTVTVLGRRLPDGPDVLQLDGPGSIARRLVDQLHHSGLDETFRCAVAIAEGRSGQEESWLCAPWASRRS